MNVDVARVLLLGERQQQVRRPMDGTATPERPRGTEHTAPDGRAGAHAEDESDGVASVRVRERQHVRIHPADDEVIDIAQATEASHRQVVSEGPVDPAFVPI